jgi:hypothetical protein
MIYQNFNTKNRSTIPIVFSRYGERLWFFQGILYVYKTNQKNPLLVNIYRCIYLHDYSDMGKMVDI